MNMLRPDVGELGAVSCRSWALDLLEALLSRLPVDDVPNGLEVFGLAILVVKVVGTGGKVRK